MKITNGFAYMKIISLCLSIKGTPPNKKPIQSKVHFLPRNSFEYAVTVELVSLFAQSLRPPPTPPHPLYSSRGSLPLFH